MRATISEELAEQLKIDYPKLGCKRTAEKHGVNRLTLAYWAYKHRVLYRGPRIMCYKRHRDPDPLPHEIAERAADIRKGWKHV